MANKKGILALVGIAGAFAWWKYRNMSEAEKEALKSKVNETGDKIKKTVADAEEVISEKYEELKETVKKESEVLKSKLSDTGEKVKEAVADAEESISEKYDEIKDTMNKEKEGANS